MHIKLIENEICVFVCVHMTDMEYLDEILSKVTRKGITIRINCRVKN